MTLNKIVGLILIALAIVAVFVTIPYVAALLVIGGLYLGLGAAAEDHVRILASALVLSGLAHTLDAVPTAGQYLSGILANLGVIVAGAAIMIVLGNMYRRFKP